jgi:hypothetical protein
VARFSKNVTDSGALPFVDLIFFITLFINNMIFIIIIFKQIWPVNEGQATAVGERLRQRLEEERVLSSLFFDHNQPRCVADGVLRLAAFPLADSSPFVAAASSLCATCLLPSS